METDTCDRTKVSIRIEARAIVRWLDCESGEIQEAAHDLVDEELFRGSLCCPFPKMVECYWLRDLFLKRSGTISALPLPEKPGRVSRFFNWLRQKRAAILP